MKKHWARGLVSKRILAPIYFAGCFIFFAFFYKYHLCHIEQMQLFRLSPGYILGYLGKPASLACLIGDFLVQFYFFKAGGAVILTTCLWGVWFLIDLNIRKFSQWEYSYLLSLVATAFVTAFHFDMVYPLSATISLIIVLVLL